MFNKEINHVMLQFVTPGRIALSSCQVTFHFLEIKDLCAHAS